MIARAESVQNWLENVTYQMNNMVSNKLFQILFGVLIFFANRPTRNKHKNLLGTFLNPNFRWPYSPNIYLYHPSQIAFLKMYSTRCAQETARDAVQIFGGRGLTQTGMGRFVEHVRTQTVRNPD